MRAKMTFRWYGKNDPVTLDRIRQIPGMTGIVSAVYDVPPGEVWPEESIRAIRKDANENGLAFEVVESVPVHEDIKLVAGLGSYQRLADDNLQGLKTEVLVNALLVDGDVSFTRK